MKTLATSCFLFLFIAVFTSCGTNQSPVQEEYDRWKAKYDSSLHYHSLVNKRHEVMLANHEELVNFVSSMENPDTALLNDIARHTQFYEEHENIMKNHAGIMKSHREFRENYETKKMSEEEVKAVLDSIKHDHYHMDIDHEYVLKMTTQIRKEHNQMRRILNEQLKKK
jgi:hypothetical protein